MATFIRDSFQLLPQLATDMRTWRLLKLIYNAKKKFGEAKREYERSALVQWLGWVFEPQERKKERKKEYLIHNLDGAFKELNTGLLLHKLSLCGRGTGSGALFWQKCESYDTNRESLACKVEWHVLGVLGDHTHNLVAWQMRLITGIGVNVERFPLDAFLHVPRKPNVLQAVLPFSTS